MTQPNQPDEALLTPPSTFTEDDATRLARDTETANAIAGSLQARFGYVPLSVRYGLADEAIRRARDDAEPAQRAVAEARAVPPEDRPGLLVALLREQGDPHGERFLRPDPPALSEEEFRAGHRSVAEIPPRRDDSVATWIKRHRDGYGARSHSWNVLDDLLDDYREHADVGRPLREIVPDRASRGQDTQGPVRPEPPDEAEEHFLDANERMGQALVAIGMAIGLPLPSPAYRWGPPEILARIAEQKAGKCPGCMQVLGPGPHWRLDRGPWWHYRCTEKAAASPAQRSGAEMLAEFHERFYSEAFGGGAPDAELRIRLHREETQELVAEIEAGNLVGIAQELADVVYVAYGTAHGYGIPLDAVLAEVHRANMSKAGADGQPVLRAEGFVPARVAAVLATTRAGSRPILPPDKSPA